MNDELFERKKPTAECLSNWTLEQFTLGLLPVGERERAQHHLDLCGRCSERVKNREQAMNAARFENVPAALRRKSQLEKRTNWFWSAGLAFSAAAALLLWVQLKNPKQTQEQLTHTRIKGAVGLEATLIRDQQVVYENVPIKQLGPLHGGDRLQLRVTGATGTYVAVQGWESQAWTVYFQGPAPLDGQLPGQVELSAAEETRLRLVACATKAALDKVLALQSVQTPADCEQTVIDLRVK